MTDQKLTALTELTAGNIADTDMSVIVDISDITMDASGTTKKWSWASIKADTKTYFDTLYGTIGAVSLNTAKTGITTAQANAITANTAKITESTTVTSPLALTGTDVSIPKATSLVNGYLSSADWTTFNTKQPAGSYTTLTGIETLTNKTLTAPVINSPTGIVKADVGLGSVENTALSTWAGTANITTLGTITTGVWNGTSIADANIVSSATWNAKEPALGNPTTDSYVLSSTIAGVRSWISPSSGVSLSNANTWTAVQTFSAQNILITDGGLGGPSLVSMTSVYSGSKKWMLKNLVNSTYPDNFIIAPYTTLGSPDINLLVLNGTNGYVGIGTINPAQALDVVGNGLFSGTLSASNLSGTNTGDQNLTPYALLTGATFTGAISATNLSGTNTGDQIVITTAQANAITANTAKVTESTTVTTPLVLTGTDVSIPASTTTVNGYMPATDFSRLANTSGTNTGDQITITGNAGTATALQTARTIGGVSFNGTANIVPNIVTDITPQLGGQLDSQANSIGFTLQTYTGVIGTTAIDFTKGNKVKFTFGAGNETLTFAAPAKTGNFVLEVVQDITGGRTLIYPLTVKWAGGTAPTLSTAAGAIDIISFYWNGTSYYGVASLTFA